jgi:hypothetical protein
MRVQVPPDRSDDPRPQLELGPRLFVDEQVEVPLPVARLEVGQAVEGVGQRPADLREQLDLGGDQRRLAAARAAGAAGDADDVAEIQVDLLLRDQLDAARAVDAAISSRSGNRFGSAMRRV